MDAVSLLSGSSSSQSSSPNAFSQLSSEEFVKIMFTELSKQDPTKPTDSSALLEQMSSLRTIQSSVDMSNKLDSLVAQNQFSSAGTMIGRTIDGIDTSGTRMGGEVVSVSRTSEGPVLKLRSGQYIPFDLVDTIVDSGGTGG